MKKMISILIIILFTSVSFAQDVVVIVGKGRTLNRDQIKKIYLGKMTQWPDGKPVKVLVNKDKEVYKAFCKKYLNKSPKAIDSKWVKLKVSKGMTIPRKVTSTVVKMLVGNSDIFIGFLEKTELAENVEVIE